jgi:DNA-binding SARP family transcriptional activator
MIAAPLRRAALELRVLGAPAMRWERGPLTIPRRQSRALLYRLAAARGPVPREQLCFLLWPDVPDSAARRNLTVITNLVRKALPWPDLLQTVDDALLLDPAHVWSDAHAFDALTAGALREGRRDWLADAAQLYRGPLLDGFVLPHSPEFAEWLEAERRRRERTLLQTLALLTELAIEQRDYLAAIGMAQRYLGVDELAEEMHARLMRLYAATGNRTAALRQFARLAAVLERELGVEPQPETRAIYLALRDSRMPQPITADLQLLERWWTAPGGGLRTVSAVPALRPPRDLTRDRVAAHPSTRPTSLSAAAALARTWLESAPL